MRRMLSVTLTGMAAVPLAGPALAADLSVKVDIPRLTVAEYHRPYVAMWVERADQSPVQTLAVWYDGKLKDGEGTKCSRTCASGGARPAATCTCRPTASPAPRARRASRA